MIKSFKEIIERYINVILKRQLDGNMRITDINVIEDMLYCKVEYNHIQEVIIVGYLYIKLQPKHGLMYIYEC